MRPAIIGGTGFTLLEDLRVTDTRTIDTPYGTPSGVLTRGELAGNEIIFLPRHGYAHTLAPHCINYRANLWALHDIGVTHVIAVTSVGGIHADIPPRRIVIPDQIIDYTHSRRQTFFGEEADSVTHVDFTWPYCGELREVLLQASRRLQLPVFDGGTYGAMQGPRLETAAEIRRMEKDGCDVVGMTGMPEASLARELGLCYAMCALCMNWAAGKSEHAITAEEIERAAQAGMAPVKRLLTTAVGLLSERA